MRPPSEAPQTLQSGRAAIRTDRFQTGIWLACLSFALGLGASGCVSWSSAKARYVDQVRVSHPDAARAYWDGNEVCVRFALAGRDVYTRAEWKPPDAGADTFHYQVAALSIGDRRRDGIRRLTREEFEVPIRPAEEWRRFQERLVAALAPKSTNEGTLMVVQNRESVLYRDRDGTPQLASLDRVPPEIAIQQAVRTDAYARGVIESMGEYLARLPSTRDRYVFATGGDPAFVLIDLRTRSTVFVSHPIDPELQGLRITPAVSVRALYSLLVFNGVLAAIKNPVTTLNRSVVRLGETGLALLPLPSFGASAAPVNTNAPPMDLDRWERDLDSLVSPRRYRARLDFLIDGEEFFPALIQSLRTARHAVDWHVYIFDNDDYAVTLADLLKARSRDLRVRVLVDQLGTLTSGWGPPQSPMRAGFQPPSSIGRYLRRDSRVRFRATISPWFTVNHKKCFLFDHTHAYLGGMNIGREYRYEWHDMMIALSGPVVGRLQRDFDRDWAHAGPLGDLAYATTSLFDQERLPAEEPGSVDVRLIYTRTGRPEIHRAQIHAIRRARKYIYIENPYFADEQILRELIAARRRGVDVRVILPSENDSGIMSASNLVTANVMLRERIRVYAYPGMTHIKAAVYDGWACVGTANFDKFSFRIGQEVNLGFSDPATVDRLNERLFHADFARSKELTEPVPVDWTDYLIEFFANEL